MNYSMNGTRRELFVYNSDEHGEIENNGERNEATHSKGKHASENICRHATYHSRYDQQNRKKK